MKVTCLPFRKATLWIIVGATVPEAVLLLPRKTLVIAITENQEPNFLHSASYKHSERDLLKLDLNLITKISYKLQRCNVILKVFILFF